MDGFEGENNIGIDLHLVNKNFARSEGCGSRGLPSTAFWTPPSPSLGESRLENNKLIVMASLGGRQSCPPRQHMKSGSRKNRWAFFCLVGTPQDSCWWSTSRLKKWLSLPERTLFVFERMSCEACVHVRRALQTRRVTAHTEGSFHGTSSQRGNNHGSEQREQPSTVARLCSEAHNRDSAVALRLFAPYTCVSKG